MIKKESIEFLYELRANNRKEWFDINRKRYENARKNFIEFNQVLIQGLEAFDDAIAQSQLDPRKTLMRINRDIRFSKDKTPYNSHLFTAINAGGKKVPTAGYYFSLDPGKSFYGAGTYKPPSDILSVIRQEIDYGQDEWEKIIADESRNNTFGAINSSDVLKRPPKGYDKENPMLEWLKRKDFFVQKFVSDEELLAEGFVNRVIEDLRKCHEMVDFLNRR